MTEWMISANAEMYDHSSSFEHFNFIDWRQGNAKFEINDIVYIYTQLDQFHLLGINVKLKK